MEPRKQQPKVKYSDTMESNTGRVPSSAEIDQTRPDNIVTLFRCYIKYYQDSSEQHYFQRSMFS